MRSALQPDASVVRAFYQHWLVVTREHFDIRGKNGERAIISRLPTRVSRAEFGLSVILGGAGEACAEPRRCRLL